MTLMELDGLAEIRSAASRRISSWDRTGGNDDCIRIDPGECRTLAEISGPGKITHIYMTLIDPHPLDYRDAVLRMYWDGAEHPSVEVPLGDFFCIGNCTVRRFASLMMAVNPGAGPLPTNNGLNCYFPMPFRRGARVEIHNQGPRILGGAMGRLWYHIDYETGMECPDSSGRFHAFWRRENPTVPWDDAPVSSRGAFPRLNTTDKHNYLMLEAEGPGHVAGLFLQVDNLHGGWYGEGDGMIVIDGEPWPPAIHGTGTEEVFGGGACPDKEYAGPYTGFVLVENQNGEPFRGKNAMYRWYIQDPVRFSRSIRMSIEHGHANDLANDYASVAYWYRRGIHKPPHSIPGFERRRPHFPEAFEKAQRLYSAICRYHVEHVQDPFVFGNVAPLAWNADMCRNLSEGYAALVGADYTESFDKLRQAAQVLEQNGITVALPTS